MKSFYKLASLYMSLFGVLLVSFVVYNYNGAKKSTLNDFTVEVIEDNKIPANNPQTVLFDTITVDGTDYSIVFNFESNTYEVLSQSNVFVGLLVLSPDETLEDITPENLLSHIE